MTEAEKLKRGTQIVYVPPHAKGRGDVEHPDAEPGFVWAVNRYNVSCRFWYRDKPRVLRTVSGSEMCPVASLVVKDTHSQKFVDGMVEFLEEVKAGAQTHD